MTLEPACVSSPLKGMITDRDIVVKVLAEGKDPRAVTAGELTQGEAVTIGADDDANEIMTTMAEHKVRRLPVNTRGRSGSHRCMPLNAGLTRARIGDSERKGPAAWPSSTQPPSWMCHGTERRDSRASPAHRND
jgi:CBS domain-containing protein